MATYHQMLAQIAELQEKAAAQRAQELAEVIGEMKLKIVEFGLTAKDLGFKSLDGPVSAEPTKRPPRPPKYREPKSGAVWSGMGKPPSWISGASNRDKFLIAADGEPAVADKPAAKKPGKQAVQTATPAKKAPKSKVASAPAKKVAAKKSTGKRGASTSEQSADAGASGTIE